MNTVIRRNHYDVTNSVFVADPRVVCKEVCAILDRIYPDCDPGPVVEVFDTFGRLYAGTTPGYVGCETWYHDAQHSLDCALVMARLLTLAREKGQGLDLLLTRYATERLLYRLSTTRYEPRGRGFESLRPRQ